MRRIPAGQVFRTPDGFAAIEGGPDQPLPPRFWVSPDGLDWSVAPLPVPAAGPVGHGEAAGEHWMWSGSDFRLWRSSDFVSWTEVDLDGLRPPSIDGVEWSFWSEGPVTVGTTAILPW